MNQPNDDQQYEYEIISEYELLKRKNRRRLIGAGAITLLAGGLFAAVANNEPKEPPQPIVYQQQKPRTIQKEVLHPNDVGKRQASDVAMASAASGTRSTANYAANRSAPYAADGQTSAGQTTDANIITPKLTHTSDTNNTLRADEMAAEPPQAGNSRSVPETARQLTEIASPAPLAKSTAPKSNIRDDQLRTTDSAAKSADDSNETPAQARKRRQEERRLARAEAAQKREAEKRERELAKQRAEQARIAKAREDERRRREAQAISAKAEADRLARQRATAERARQAQLAAERNRQAEREKMQAQQRAANDQQRRLVATRAAEQQRNRATEEAARKNATASANKNNTGKAVVQAGAFRERDRALQTQQKLRSLNYSARIEEVNTSKGKMYRVQTGTFANRNEAEQAASKMKNHGLGGMVIEHK